MSDRRIHSEDEIREVERLTAPVTTLTPEREQEIRELDTRFCEYNMGCSCCEFRLPLLAEIDRLRTELAVAVEALERIAADDLMAPEVLHVARKALDRIGGRT